MYECVFVFLLVNFLKGYVGYFMLVSSVGDVNMSMFVINVMLNIW